MRPIIGINMALSPDHSDSPVASIRAEYIDAVTSAGGIALVLPAVCDPEAIERLTDLCQGFVFIGGGDIDPARYGAKAHPTTNKLSSRREQYDFALLDLVVKSRKPFLGVCLGCQEMAVAFGGDLYQDIHSETSSTLQHYMRHDPYVGDHEVAIEKGTRLFDLLETTTLKTNSAHHQAIRTPGQQVKVSAHTSDGIIEAVELVDYPFGLGVQWHPEQLTDNELHLKLFKGLVEASQPRPHGRGAARAARERSAPTNMPASR